MASSFVPLELVVLDSKTFLDDSFWWVILCYRTYWMTMLMSGTLECLGVPSQYLWGHRCE